MDQLEQLAKNCMTDGDYPNALEYYLKLIGLAKNSQSNFLLSKFEVQAAEININLEKYDQAAKHYRRAAEAIITNHQHFRRQLKNLVLMAVLCCLAENNRDQAREILNSSVLWDYGDDSSILINQNRTELELPEEIPASNDYLINTREFTLAQQLIDVSSTNQLNDLIIPYDQISHFNVHQTKLLLNFKRHLQSADG